MASLKKYFQLLLPLSLLLSQFSLADVELPMGSLSGCPFKHDDSYDMSALISTLKSQIGANLNNRNECRAPLQAIMDNLAPLQNFYKTLDPGARQKITRSVYANSLSALNTQRLTMEAGGKTSLPEYTSLLTRISSIESSNELNSIDLDSLRQTNFQNGEAFYRTQLLGYTSNVLAVYNTTSRTKPQCIEMMGGWSSALSAVLGGFSLASSLGVNPTAQLIGSAIGVGAQLVSLLQDPKARKGYNELVKLENQQNLACTYYSIKKASCEYQRSYRIAQETANLRNFVHNRFAPGFLGEYERYFVNRGRIKFLGEIFALVAQMGSPLTLDISLLTNYLLAKGVDFVSLGEPPPANSADDVLKGWLLRAKAFGVSFSEYNHVSGGPEAISTQFTQALTDIRSKKATILATEKIIRANLSFLDLKRRLSSDSPILQANLGQMISYLTEMRSSALVPDSDKGTVDAALSLVTKLEAFRSVVISSNGTTNPNYEDEVISKGGFLFEELAKGSVAQLTQQSVIALGGKGVDRMTWAFGVIRNAYVTRDAEQNLPQASRFTEYQKDRDVLSNVIADYQVFSGTGTTFRNEQFTKPLHSFEDSFKKEMLESLKYALNNHHGIKELEGQTAAQLCAVYLPSLKSMSKNGLFGDNLPSQIAGQCQDRFKTLKSNHLVVDTDFNIDYNDDCTYFNYIRELDIQNLEAQLIVP